MEPDRYRAFISYRHISPDAEIAKKLHTAIETFKLPASVKKATGVTKMGRVFRDQEELPLSADLGGDIEEALKSSEWLIVICSPKLLESRWCMREIDTFIALGKRDHILCVLADGEPEQSFPPQLRVMEKNGQLIPIEPLAADVRADSLQASFRKLKGEKLRLLAPMLGIHYDDLKQRAKARRQRIALTASLSALALVLAFSVYAVIQNRRIERERDAARNNEMRLLIEKSNVEVQKGNKKLASGYLAEAAAIRENVGTGNDDALNGALEYALYRGLFEPILSIDTGNRSFSSMVFSEDDSMLLGVTNLNSASLIDAATGQIRFTISRAMTGQIDTVGFLDGDEYLYMVDSWYGFVSIYSAADGSFVNAFDDGTDSAWNIGDRIFPLGDHRILIVLRDCMVIWDYLTDSQQTLLENEDMPFGFTQPLLAALSHSGERIAVGSTGRGAGGFVCGLSGEDRIALEIQPERGYMNPVFSPDDRYLALESGSMGFVFDLTDGKPVLSFDMTNGGSPVSTLRFSPDGSRLVLPCNGKLRCFSVPGGDLLWETAEEVNLGGDGVLTVSPDGRYLAVSGSGGIFDLATGEKLSDVSATAFSHDGSLVLLNAYTAVPKLAATDLSATVKRLEGCSDPISKTVRYTDPAEQIQVTLSHNPGSFYSEDPTVQARTFTDPTLRYLAYAHPDGFVELFDLEKGDGSAFAAYGEHCYHAVTDLVFHGSLLASAGGFDRRAVLFDCESGQILRVLQGSGFAEGVEFSPDGTKLMLLCTDRQTGAETACVYSVRTGDLLFTMEAEEKSVQEFGFSEDGARAILKLSDGSAVVGTLYADLDEMLRVLDRKE